MNSPEKLRIVAVGGAPGKELLKEGLDLTGVEGSPNVLLMPTAKTTQAAHDKTVQLYGSFFRELDLPTEVLHDFDSMPSEAEVREKLEEADMVYVAGGDTDRMMNVWRKHGIDRLLTARTAGGLVLTGISAGAIAPFAWGHSDSLSFRVDKGDPWEYIPVETLGLVRAGITPHYDTHPVGHTQSRADMFQAMFEEEWEARQTPIGFGIDNGAGVIIADGVLRASSTDTTSKVIRLYGEPLQTEILDQDIEIPLREVLPSSL